MDMLFIDRKGTELAVDGGRLLVRVPDAVRAVSLPLRQLRYVAVSASVGLSSSVLLAFDKEDITLVLIHPHQTRTMVVNRFVHGAVQRRLQQCLLVSQEPLCLALAVDLVRAKVLSHLRVVLRWLRQRPALRRVLFSTARQLRDIHGKLGGASDLDQLRGLEGAAAAAWFAVYAEVLPVVWGFSRRLRRPPPDPVNALLSLTYTLIHGEAVRALSAAGLDPALGVLHEPTYNRASLACDLVELLRAEVDEWVLQLLRAEVLRPGHFATVAEGGCLLNKEGRAVFYALYQGRGRRWQSRCRDLAQRFVQRVEGADHAGSSLSVY
jgi:CRISP-associated protein Cas1